MADAVFIPAGDGRFRATEVARGPWDPGAQHGGAPAALLMRGFEHAPAAESLQIARVTYELLRPVPLGELDLTVEVIRPGRRVQLLEGSLRTPDGTAVVRARALQVQRADPGAAQPSSAVPARGPEEGEPATPPVPDPDAAFFGSHAMEIRFVAGKFFEPGPATAWFRLRMPVVEGEEPSPLQRLAVAADFGNGIGAALPWGEWLFINPDLTLYIDRPPAGEWVCLDAQTRIASGGVAVAESTLYDQQGIVGRAIQALLVAPR
ncbi:MAG: thioesterase family protein [Solirubrobacteraceae bacterium]